MTFATIASAALFSIACSSTCLADDIIAAEQTAAGKLAFLLKPTFTNATLSVAGPNDFHASTFTKGGALAIDLSQFGKLDDGIYKYQLTASGPERVAVRTPLDNGRDSPPETTRPVGVSMSGIFRVKGGEIVKPDKTKPERKDQ